MDTSSFRPICVRIARCLHTLLCRNFRGLTDTADMILWDRRELNTIADHAANVALDVQRPWREVHMQAFEEANKAGTNFRLCVDGACRNHQHGSVGFALFAYLPGERRSLILRAGKPVDDVRSAFLAELLAMEWGLHIFLRLMNCCGKATLISEM